MKNKFFFVISFILIFLIGFYLYISLEQKKESFRTAEIRGRKFDLEVVATEETRQKGLGGRDALCSNCGMLFVFSQSGNHSFWMKDMRFNLDIIWISGGKIVYIAKNLDFKKFSFFLATLR